MPNRHKLTNNSDETAITDLLSGDTVFSIPYFQRAYKWRPSRIRQLNEDILDLVDEVSDFHFLGAVIVHGRRSNPSDPSVFEVIDGQQRITTLYLYLCAIVKLLCECDQIEDANSLLLKYLVIGRSTKLLSNAKLHPCKDDRRQLNSVLADVLSDGRLSISFGGDGVRPLPATGEVSGTLKKNYGSILKFLKAQQSEGGIERLQAIYAGILEAMSVVQIDVWDPTNGPKIFDSLNSRQEPMTTGDLVRNEIFSRAVTASSNDSDQGTIEALDNEHWQPFYRKFQQDKKNLFDSYFFPYGLIQNANLRKSEVYSNLRDEWQSKEDPKEIIGALAKYQDAFLDIVCGTNYQEHGKDVALGFRRLWELGAPGTTYPFLMQLSEAVKEEILEEPPCANALSVIESFLVRRALCGHEPTGLHAVFKRLWGDTGGKPDRESVKAAIRKHRTVVWPSEDDVRDAVGSRSLDKATMTKFVILEYDRSLGGDAPGEVPWIEHILPESPRDEWYESFPKEEASEMRHLLANLIPLSAKMNQELSNRAYAEKKGKYREDSMFKSARKLAEDYDEWTPATLAERSAILAEWVIQRWPH